MCEVPALIKSPVLGWVPVRPGFVQPLTRAYNTDAGFDLAASEDCVVPSGGFVDVPTNVALDLPANTWGFLTGRSSTFRKHGLLVINGIIDESYTGELFFGVVNLSDHSMHITQGQRLAQLIVIPMVPGLTLRSLDRVDKPGRGSRGFGSTGDV